jgi:hypothetical protein
VKGFSGSVGLAYNAGKSPLKIDLPGSGAAEVRVHSLRFLYAVSIAF